MQISRTSFSNLIIRIVLTAFLAAGTICTSAQAKVTPGADRPDIYLPMLEGKRIGLLSNHTGVVRSGHTLDLMRSLGLDVRVIFSPEHGFRGTADAGSHVGSSTDPATGLPIVSLYDKSFKAKADAAVDSLDVIVTDLQDVGTRFYTYYITMMELMNRAARKGKEFVVFDRPNPNGMYVDGPILKRELYSGVGRLPIPTVHGMTLGELARMIVGEKWLDGGRRLDLKVVPCEGYTHSMKISLPVAPSPNLRSDIAIALYPSLCYFEGTPISVGRGTDNPFTLYGAPTLGREPGSPLKYTFTPKPAPGAASPPHNGKRCTGESLAGLDIDSVHAAGINLEYVIRAYRSYKRSGAKEPFFRRFFDLLAGDESVRRQIEAGKSAEEIRRSWQADDETFRRQRRPYLLYPEQ